MKLVAAYLDRTGAFARLRHPFEASARAVMPGVPVEVIELTPEPASARDRSRRRRDINRAFIAAAEVAAASTVPVAVCDLDLLFLRSIEDAWALEFDLAVTVRESSMPFNTGLYFTRPTAAARAFLARWVQWARYFEVRDGAEVERHGGVDQAALARTLDEGGRARVVRLPCREWNATQSEWASIDSGCRVLHVKSGLRRACLQGESPPAGLGWAVDLWRSYECASVPAA